MKRRILRARILEFLYVGKHSCYSIKNREKKKWRRKTTIGLELESQDWWGPPPPALFSLFKYPGRVVGAHRWWRWKIYSRRDVGTSALCVDVKEEDTTDQVVSSRRSKEPPPGSFAYVMILKTRARQPTRGRSERPIVVFFLSLSDTCGFVFLLLLLKKKKRKYFSMFFFQRGRVWVTWLSFSFKTIATQTKSGEGTMWEKQIFSHTSNFKSAQHRPYSKT